MNIFRAHKQQLQGLYIKKDFFAMLSEWIFFVRLNSNYKDSL